MLAAHRLQDQAGPLGQSSSTIHYVDRSGNITHTWNPSRNSGTGGWDAFTPNGY